MRAAGERLAGFIPGRFRDQYLHFQDGALNSFRGGRMPLQIALGHVGMVDGGIARFYFVAQAMGLDMAMSIAMFAALANAIMTTIPVPGGLGFVETALDHGVAADRVESHRCVHAYRIGSSDFLVEHRCASAVSYF